MTDTIDDDAIEGVVVADVDDPLRLREVHEVLRPTGQRRQVTLGRSEDSEAHPAEG